MLVGSPQSHANLANSQKGAGGTDFSIAAIMARGPSSREPSERSSSKFEIENILGILRNILKSLLIQNEVFLSMKAISVIVKCSSIQKNESFLPPQMHKNIYRPGSDYIDAF